LQYCGQEYKTSNLIESTASISRIKTAIQSIRQFVSVSHDLTTYYKVSS